MRIITLAQKCVCWCDAISNHTCHKVERFPKRIACMLQIIYSETCDPSSNGLNGFSLAAQKRVQSIEHLTLRNVGPAHFSDLQGEFPRERLDEKV